MAEPSEDRWSYLVGLDDELLLGSAVVSEWAAFMVRQADIAFAMGADLATILAVVSAIETHLRAGYGNNSDRLSRLINLARIDESLRADLHDLRRYRNRWVHVDSPNEDSDVLENPQHFEAELASRARMAVRVLRRTLYYQQGV